MLAAFYTLGALYLLLFDVSAPRPPVEALRQWITSIQACAPGAVVILVGRCAVAECACAALAEPPPTCAVPSVLLRLMVVLAGSHADEAASPAAAARTCSLVLAKVRHSLRPGGRPD